MMRRLIPVVIVVMMLAVGAPVSAHDAPFSYLDLRFEPAAIHGTLVVHVIDVAYELDVERPPDLLEPEALRQRAADAIAVLEPRLQIVADGFPLNAVWSDPKPDPQRDALRIAIRYELPDMPGRLAVRACLFAYDPNHQTFLNVYEEDVLGAQSVLTCARPEADYFTGTRQGALAVVAKFVPAGIHHILIGPDHLLFLMGLLLLGGSLRKLFLVVTAFTVAHSITLSLAALEIFSPPPEIIEPAIALSIVYVGADNLLVRSARDARAWIALTFGLIHGFGFAYVLREMDLPGRALGWSLFSFNLGVEIGQLCVIVPVALAVTAARARSEVLGRRLVYVGSILVIAMGGFWFVERVFF